MSESPDTCGCGHRTDAHDSRGCAEVWRYPDVLNARPCGCVAVWRATEAGGSE